MNESIISAPHFHDEKAAYLFVESRIWPSGPICPHCGRKERISQMRGKSTRIGLYKCYVCRKPFTVKMGTIFEDSHIPLRLWLQAIYLIASSKKGISSNQLHRTLGITLKSAWFLSHRIRESMREGGFVPFGGNGGAVEVDETFLWNDPDKPKRRAYHHKNKILSLVDRSAGTARSVVVEDVNAKTLLPVIKENILRESRIMTDDAGQYRRLNRHFSDHGVVNHSIGEYVSFKDPTIHTNTVESYFSIFKRGMRGVYQHCAKKHLHRYLAEFDFRYNDRIKNEYNDMDRAEIMLFGVRGKRLTYKTTHRRPVQKGVCA